MSELTQLKDEATRLLTLYVEYRDCNDEQLRRKTHIDLDRFLMEHREVAALLMVQGLQDAFDSLVDKPEKPAPWYKRIIGVIRNGNSKDKKHKEAIHHGGP